MHAPQVQGPGAVTGPQEWFESLPIVTKYWFGATVLLTLAGNFDVINLYYVPFSWLMIKSKLQLWRLATCFCYAGPFELGTLIEVYMLQSMSLQYERGGPYNTGAGGGTADYVFAMMFATITIILTYPLMQMILPVGPVFTKNLISFVLYVWSKKNPQNRANIWGVPVQSLYLPFAHLAFSVFTGNRWTPILHGMMVGHLYYFLVDVVPQVQGKDILRTPQFLIDQFGIGEYRPAVAPMPPRARATAAAAGSGGRPAGVAAGTNAGGYNWGGAGRPLGRE